MKIKTMKHPIFIMILFLLLFPIFLHAQEENPVVGINDITASDVITSIEIIGLKRTRLQIVKYPLEKFLGQSREDFDQNEVIVVIKGLNVIEPVLVELVESLDGLVLQVTVEEKWTIFPFPLIFTGSGETILGLFFCDLNAFGLGDMAVLGGAYSSNGWSVITIYNHTQKRQGLPGWNVVFFYNQHENEDVDRDEKIHRMYTTDQLLFSAGINYVFKDVLTGSLSLYFRNISLHDDIDNFLNPPNEGAMHIGINPRLSLRQSSWDGFFLSNKSISLEYSYSQAIIGESFQQVGYSANYEKSLFPGFRFSLRSGGVWKSTLNPLFEEGPQKAMVNILPRNYSALHYAS
jgi:hypothetical protein